MIGCDFHYRDKIPVGILGATGSVGQKFVQLLSTHPWFEIVALAASSKSVGHPYGTIAKWQMPVALVPHIAEMQVRECKPDFPCSIIFSGLDSSVAGEIETNFAQNGYTVISNSSNHRMDKDVPLVIPEVNSDHLALLTHQNTRGKIITNPNCSVIGLSIALKPLDTLFGIEAVNVVTLQAVSGAGFKGRMQLDIEDNIIPYIKGEEGKIETELLKILGRVENQEISCRTFPVSAQCNRVPVSDGHLLCVSIKLNKKTSEAAIIQAWREFQGEPQELKLPTAPKNPIHYFSEEAFPQTKHHRNLEQGMGVSVGRLQKCPLLDYKFIALSHNTVRGAAGGAISIAELMVKKGMVYW